jgi:RHS repeat-associated protein
MLNTNAVIHTVVWDPTEPVATRPLLLSTPSGWHTHSFDQVKNVTELFDATGVQSATYDYAPFGAVSASSGSAVPLNPFTFSSEIGDIMLGLVYYNFRHMNPLDGAWLTKDHIEERGGFNLYAFVSNAPGDWIDWLGLDRLVFDGKQICRMSDDLQECKKCWQAASGKDIDGNGKFDDFSEEDQKRKGEGPIPEGEYLLPAKKTTDPSKEGNWDTDDWNDYEKNDGDGWKPWKTNVDPRSKKGWGDRFGRLKPDPKTNTHGRSHFNVHGGEEPGSAGCIDIGCNDKDFFDDVRKDFGDGNVPVTVDYSGNSTKACNECKDRKENAWP